MFGYSFPWGIIYLPKELKNQIKWFSQKLLRGYSDPEVWDVQWHNAKWLIPRLKKLRLIHHGYPACLQKSDKHFDKKYVKEWRDILDSLIKAFELIVDDDTWEFDKDKRRVVEKGLKLFAEYYTSLWD